MGHGPAVKLGKDDAASFKTSLGVKMFFGYTFFYVIFIALNVYAPKTMETIIFGQTAAVLWGFFLLALALIMAVIYNHFCTQAEKRYNS
ncbi:MAG: hypothetical protein R6V21_09745 [Pelovirga sp.]